MESGAKGCEVIVSGKLRGQRAKAMKFVDGLMIHSGDPTNHFIQRAVKHVELRQGVLGIKIRIMLNWDPTGNYKMLSQFIFNKMDSLKIHHRYIESECNLISHVLIELDRYV
jgi:ribosomal protein S3